MPEIEPITREETYYARTAGDNITVPEPVTHKEHFLYALATGETGSMPEPVTREEHFIGAAAENVSRSSVTVEPLSVTENGTYTAPSGEAYSPVTVNVDEIEPEILMGTVAEPWTMAQAEALWNLCKAFAPHAAVLTCIPVNTVGVLQCVTLAGGSSANRRLIVGASAPTGSSVGVVSIQYSLDDEGNPREHVQMGTKDVWKCAGDDVPQDVSALVSDSSSTKTLVSLYPNSVPIGD